MLLVVAVSALLPVGAGPDICSGLSEALVAAEAGDGFAAISGQHAGLYRETSLRLPGAEFCTVDDGHPDATWRCLMSSPERYNLALEAVHKLARRVESCLGEGWSREEVEGDTFYREFVLTHPDSVARFHIVVTHKVEKAGNWKGYRILVFLRSPHR